MKPALVGPRSNMVDHIKTFKAHTHLDQLLKVMVPLLTYREQFQDMKGRIDKCEARRADYDRLSNK